MKLKRAAYEYVVSKLLEWGGYIDSKSYEVNKLGLNQLLFLVAIIKDEEGNDLLDIFDSFYATPTGVAECDISFLNRKDKLLAYRIKDRSIEKKGGRIILKRKIKNRIDKSIYLLRKKNEDLIKYNPFRLVGIVKLYHSYKMAYDYAEFCGNLKEIMEIDSIREDCQIFK